VKTSGDIRGNAEAERVCHPLADSAGYIRLRGWCALRQNGRSDAILAIPANEIDLAHTNTKTGEH
jgi:hypothetical protein